MPVSTHTIPFTSALPNKGIPVTKTSLHLRSSIIHVSLSRERAYNGSGIAVQQLLFYDYLHGTETFLKS
jgi:hypothetical protein